MRVLAVTSFVVLLSLTSAYPQQAVDPAYLQQYYQQIAQQTQAARGAGGATPIYEQEAQEPAQQYVQQGQQYRIKDTVSEQARQQQQAPQQAYVAPVVRQQQQHYEQPQAQEPQTQYISQQQPVVYKSAPKQQIRRPAPQPQYQEPQHQQGSRLVKDEEEDYGNDSPNYQFGFDVKDDEFTNYQNRKESREGNVIKGSYSVVDSDGFLRTVNYVADPKEGFKAEVVRTPTDIVIKVPQQQTPETRHQPQQQQQQQQQQTQQQQPQYAQHQYRQPQQAQKAAPQYQYE